MKIRRVQIRNFRGIADLDLIPQGHTLLVGPPGAGSSTAISAINRVLHPDATRWQVDELDYYDVNTDQPIRIEITCGDLGELLEQEFFDHLEFWDASQQQLITEVPPGDTTDNFETVVRLAYWAEWDDAEEAADSWVYFPKNSDIEAHKWSRVSRRQREHLPFLSISATGDLDLSSRSTLWRLLRDEDPETTDTALANFLDRLEDATTDFSSSPALAWLIQSILDSVNASLWSNPPDEVDLRFGLSSGSLTTLLRTMEPLLQAGGSDKWLPLHRHGSTRQAVLGLAPALLDAAVSEAVVLIDDLGTSLSTGPSQALAGRLRQSCAQTWIASKRQGVVRTFRPSEIVRLTPSTDAEPSTGVFQLAAPGSRDERKQRRHLNSQLSAVLSERALVVVEGPQDLASYATWNRIHLEKEGEWLLPPATAQIVHPAAEERHGGVTGALELSRFVRSLGFIVVMLLDGDEETLRHEEDLLEVGDVVIRLPDGVAIERAIVKGVSPDALATATLETATTYGVSHPYQTEVESDDVASAISANQRPLEDFLKSTPGLHAQFLDALPQGTSVPILESALRLADSSARQNDLDEMQIVPAVDSDE